MPVSPALLNKNTKRYLGAALQLCLSRAGRINVFRIRSPPFNRVPGALLLLFFFGRKASGYVILFYFIQASLLSERSMLASQRTVGAYCTRNDFYFG